MQRVMPEATELQMMRDALLVPHMLTMLEKAMSDMEHSGHLLKRLHMMAMQNMMDLLMKKQHELRTGLRSAGIKLYMDDYDVEFSGFVYNYKYVYRGYQHQFGMTRDVMKSEISMKFASYIAEVGDWLQREMRAAH